MYTGKLLRSAGGGTGLCVAVGLLSLAGCGTDLDQLLFQTAAATGRTLFDIVLTDIANDLADALEREGESGPDSDDGAGNDGDGDNGSDGDGDGGGDAGEVFFASNNCAACHCEDAGGGCALDAPPLVGVEADALDDRLRGDADHPGGKFELSDEDLAALQLYLASLGDSGAPSFDDLIGDPDAGEAIYSSNGCASCHCADAVGGCALDAPPLVGVGATTLDDMLRQDAQHPSAKLDLTDQEIVDLEAYLAGV